MLCDRCSDIEFASRANQKVSYTHLTLAEALNSAIECEGCDFFCDALKHYSLSDSPSSPGFQTDQGDFRAEIAAYLSKPVTIRSETNDQNRFEDITVRIAGEKGVYSTPLEAFLSRGSSIPSSSHHNSLTGLLAQRNW